MRFDSPSTAAAAANGTINRVEVVDKGGSGACESASSNGISLLLVTGISNIGTTSCPLLLVVGFEVLLPLRPLSVHGVVLLPS